MLRILLDLPRSLTGIRAVTAASSLWRSAGSYSLQHPGLAGKSQRRGKARSRLEMRLRAVGTDLYEHENLMSSTVPFLKSFYNAVSRASDGSARPVWHEQAGRWIVFNADTATQVLRSQSFSVMKHYEEIESLQKKHGLDLQSSIAAARVFPLSHDGDEHRELKRLAGQIVQEIFAPAVEAFRAHCSELLPQLLEGRQSFDIVTDLVSPVSARLFSVLAAIDESHFNRTIPSGYCPTQLLTSAKQSLSPSRWRALNNQITERYSRIGGVPPGRIMRSSLSLLTFEILKAAFCNSLIQVFRQGGGLPLNEIDIPAQLPCTSIPFIDRVCNTDTEVAGEMIRSGENVLVYLGGCTGSDHEHRKLFFGTGAHICVGKPITENSWAILADLLRNRTERITVREVGFRDFDVVLLSPDTAIVDVAR